MGLAESTASCHFECTSFFLLMIQKLIEKTKKKHQFFPPFFFCPNLLSFPGECGELGPAVKPRLRVGCAVGVSEAPVQFAIASGTSGDGRGRWVVGSGERVKQQDTGWDFGVGKGVGWGLVGKVSRIDGYWNQVKTWGGSRINDRGKVPRWGALMPNLSLGNCFLWQMEGKWSCMLFSIKKFTKFTNWDRGVGVMFLPLRPNDCFCSFISLSCLILGMPWVKTRVPQPPWVSHQQLQTRAQAFDMWQNEGIFFEVFDWVEVLQVPSNFRSLGQNRAKHLIWLGGMSLAMQGAPRESGLKCQHFPKRMQCRFNFYWEVAASPSFPSAG